MPGLRETAEADLVSIVENDATGFGWSISVTDPSGTVVSLKGLSNDIAELIDPETGVAVTGRYASVAIAMESLEAAGLGLPEGVSDETSKPWIIGFNDIKGNPFIFKVKRSSPDRALGIITCEVEVYKP